MKLRPVMGPTRGASFALIPTLVVDYALDTYAIGVVWGTWAVAIIVEF